MIPVAMSGSGPDVVVLHGPPLPPESMAPLPERLAGSHRVFVPDYRGLAVGPVETARQLADGIEAGAIDPTPTLLDLWFTPKALAERPGLEPLFRGWFEDFGAAGLATCARTDFRGPDLRPRLVDLAVPVLLIAGALDRAALPTWAEELAALLPEARLETLEGVGHFAHLEDPDGVVAALGPFLAP